MYALGVGQESSEMDFSTLLTTQSKQHSASSIFYRPITCRRKNIPISVKKQDTCISREHQSRRFLFISYIKPSSKYSLHAASLFTAIWAYIKTRINR